MSSLLPPPPPPPPDCSSLFHVLLQAKVTHPLLEANTYNISAECLGKVIGTSSSSSSGADATSPKPGGSNSSSSIGVTPGPTRRLLGDPLVTQMVLTGVVTTPAKYSVKYQINDTEPVLVGVFEYGDPVPKIKFDQLKDLDDVSHARAQLRGRQG